MSSVMNKVAAVMLACVLNTAWGEVLWLSETPPSKRVAASEVTAVHEHAEHVPRSALPASAVSPTAGAEGRGTKKHQHAGGAEVDADGEVVADNTHSGKKQVWLRSGDDPRGAAYVSGVQGSLALLGRSGALPDVSWSEEKGRTSVKLEISDLGFYNAYWVRKAAHDGMLHVDIAKAELLHGTCCSKDVDEDEAAKPIINTSLPLDLVRTHYPDEGLFTRIVSGDRLEFTVYSLGKPAAGAKVTMISNKGWRNSQTSDENGHVTFTMIRDYYPSWLEFQKRQKQTYLMTAELTLNEGANVDGVNYDMAHYSTTLAGSYYPSPYDYRSYAWGLGIAFFVIVFGGLGVYLYRRRRLKPYQEVRVDDKA